MMTEEPKYLLSSHPEQLELERLQLQEESIDWVSIGRLTGLGLRSGSRCMEAGVGAGSMARWMTSAVGDNGHAVGIDMELRYAALLDGCGIDLRRQDLLNADLDADYFDFVHCRLLLMHLAPADRQKLLAQFKKTLKSGGWLVVCDSSFDYRPVAPVTRGQELWYRLLDAICAAGAPRIDFALGSQLPAMLHQAGFRRVEGMGFFAIPANSRLQEEFITRSAEAALRLDLVDPSAITREEIQELVKRTEAGEIRASMPYGMAWGRCP